MGRTAGVDDDIPLERRLRALSARVERGWSGIYGSFGDYQAGCGPQLPEELLPFYM